MSKSLMKNEMKKKTAFVNSIPKNCMREPINYSLNRLA